jgi:molybdopterin molybdotransferase
MDGYAVRSPAPYRLIAGHIRPGRLWDGALGPGDAIEISTGAAVPADATQVVRAEDIQICGRTLFVGARARSSYIRRAGEDAAQGEVVSHAGMQVTPALLGLAAACGYDSLVVTRRPAVALLVTGDELIASGSSGIGMLRDALGPMLGPLVRQMGGDVVGTYRVPDSPPDALDGKICHCAASAVSVVLVTGSTSAGRYDRLRRYLRASGATVVVDSVACRPGHPQLLAMAPDGMWIIGLPGNPLAALVAAHTLLAPLLAGLCNRPIPSLRKIRVTGEVPEARGDMTRIFPVVWSDNSARILPHHQPASLRGAALADGLAVLPTQWIPGDLAQVILSSC